MAEAMAMAEFDGGIGESNLFVPISIYCGISGVRKQRVLGLTAVSVCAVVQELCEGQARERERAERACVVDCGTSAACVQTLFRAL